MFNVVAGKLFQAMVNGNPWLQMHLLGLLPPTDSESTLLSSIRPSLRKETWAGDVNGMRANDSRGQATGFLVRTATCSRCRQPFGRFPPIIRCAECLMSEEHDLEGVDHMTIRVSLIMTDFI